MHHPMNRVNDIALFLQVLEHGSISAAARQMDLSAAVASQRLQRLEAELGVRLLHRTTRRLYPTPEGQLLAQEGRPLVEELEALGNLLQQRGGAVSGTLKVTAPASFGNQYIAPLLPDFLAAHPGLGIHLHLDDRRVDLVGEGFDLAIRIGVLEDSSLVSRRLADNERVLCASPDYLRRRGKPVKPADLLTHDCIVQTGHHDTPNLWRLVDAGGQTHQLRVTGVFQSNFGDALRHASLNGLGISMHSVWHVHEDLRAGCLEQVLPDCRLPASGIHAVMPARTLTPARVRAFVDHLARVLQPPSWTH